MSSASLQTSNKTIADALRSKLRRPGPDIGGTCFKFPRNFRRGSLLNYGSQPEVRLVNLFLSSTCIEQDHRQCSQIKIAASRSRHRRNLFQVPPELPSRLSP